MPPVRDGQTNWDRLQPKSLFEYSTISRHSTSPFKLGLGSRKLIDAVTVRGADLSFGGHSEYNGHRTRVVQAEWPARTAVGTVSAGPEVTLYFDAWLPMCPAP